MRNLRFLTRWLTVVLPLILAMTWLPAASGMASAPVASLSPSPLTFASTTVGATAATQAITLSNTGNAALSFVLNPSGVAISITGTNASSFSQTNTCGSTVAAGASCKITVTFKPTGAGALTAAVNISDNAANSPQKVALSGTGVTPAPVVSLSSSSLTFASTTVGTTAATQAITLSNTGTAALSFVSATGPQTISITGTNASSFSQTNTCGSSVAAGASCKITVTFKPTGASALTAAVNINDNAVNSPQKVALSGTAQSGYPVSGSVYENNCGGGSVPGVKISISTSPVQSTTTGNDGSFTFTNIPNGTYTITPSIAGPSSLFYPASQSITVNSGFVNANFQATLGYTVSGTVAYSGTHTGQVYLALNSNSCGGSTLGTSITKATLATGGGAFTIRGVPPGSYSLQAWMDNLGLGAQNVSNPTGSSSSLTVSAANLSGVTVKLKDPTAVTLSSTPSIQGVSPFNDGAIVSYQPIVNANGVEMATSYNLQWSTDKKFGSVTGKQTFNATGANGANIWIVNGLTNGAQYYFEVQGVAGNSTSGWYEFSSPVTIDAPTGGYVVSGKVTFAGSATGPLYVGFYNQSTGSVYATQVGSKLKPPTSPASYSVDVPTGSNYFFFGIIDQNNDGMVDVGDIQNTNGNNSSAVSVTGAATKNLTLPSSNSIVSLSTNHSRYPNSAGTASAYNDSYNLSFNVGEQIKLPVAATLTSGPNVLSPVDFGLCADCGHTQFNFWTSLSGAPKVGDTYGLTLTYSDGASEAKTAAVGAVLSAFATNLLPTGSGVSATPNFSWTYPASASSYNYQFQLRDSNGNTIWQIPSNNSNLNGFSSSVTSLAWGVDPLSGDNSVPLLSTLLSGSAYNWQITAQDINNNSAQIEANFETKALALSLPNPSSIGSAIVGQSYTGTINASGGTSNWDFTVNGAKITAQSPVSLGNGTLTASNSGNQTLIISGTPSKTGTVTLIVSVTDNSGNGSKVGPYSYTIAVASASPVSLPAANTNPLGSALVGASYAGAINASGGTGGGNYSFTVNGIKVPIVKQTTSTPTSWTRLGSSGDGLLVANSGGNTLWFSGTPTTAKAVPLSVTVADTTNTSDTATVSYTLPVVNMSSANNANLKGRYSCLVNGFNDKDSSRWATLVSVQADGQGDLSGGVFDTNSRDDTVAAAGAMNGAYSIGTDNNGLMTTTAVLTSGGTGSATNKWAIALTDTVKPAQGFRMVEIDDTGSSPSGQHGAGNCYLDTPSAFVANTISGNSFVFSLNGEGDSGTLKASLGRFSASGGNITLGNIDQAKLGSAAVTPSAFTGAYSTPDSTTGRFTLAISGSVSLVDYIVDANRSFLLQTNSGQGAMAGNVRKQQLTSYSKANVNGPFILYMDGVEIGSNGAVSGYDSQVFQGRGDGAGNITINQSYNDEAGAAQDGGANGGPIALTFDPAYAGRVTFTPGSGQGYLYFFNTNTALEMSVNTDGSPDWGWVEPQVLPTGVGSFSDAAIAGTYMMGQMASADPAAYGNVGEFTLTGSGVINGDITTAGNGDFSWDQSMSGLTYDWSPVSSKAGSWGSAAYGTFSVVDSSSSKGNLSCAVINPTKSVCTQQTEPSPSVIIFQQ
jgi:hypothetical protein